MMNGHLLECWDMECSGCVETTGAELPMRPQEVLLNPYCMNVAIKKEVPIIREDKKIKQPSGVKQYKCRVECDIDVERMRNRLKVKGVIDGEAWVFNDRRTLKTIRKLMGECMDCHVAQQTVQPIADYTGIRVYMGE
jgi:hypothetical protein